MSPSSVPPSSPSARGQPGGSGRTARYPARWPWARGTAVSSHRMLTGRLPMADGRRASWFQCSPKAVGVPSLPIAVCATGHCRRLARVAPVAALGRRYSRGLRIGGLDARGTAGDCGCSQNGTRCEDGPGCRDVRVHSRVRGECWECWMQSLQSLHGEMQQPTRREK